MSLFFTKLVQLDPDPHSFYLLDPNPNSEKLLDPDQQKMNAEPQPCSKVVFNSLITLILMYTE